MKTVVVIPARFASTRLPQKMLIEVKGKPIIQWTYESVARAAVDQIIIAVDHPLLLSRVRQFGAEVIMTSEHHATGTDRVIEVLHQLKFNDDDIVVNVQGDEPLIPIDNVTQLVQTMRAEPSLKMATLCEKIHDLEDVFNPNIVKVVRDAGDYALYFSRAPIPWARGFYPQSSPDHQACYRHLGLYAYRAGFLKNYDKLSPSPLESLEILEQLRALYHGVKIHVAEASCPSGPGIDTEADIERFKRLIGQRAN